MHIIVEKSRGELTVLVLIGQINDHLYLSGLWNARYDINMTIITVNLLKIN